MKNEKQKIKNENVKNLVRTPAQGRNESATWLGREQSGPGFIEPNLCLTY